MIKFFQRAGKTLQIIILGELLFIGIAKMSLLESGIRLFRYAGF